MSYDYQFWWRWASKATFWMIWWKQGNGTLQSAELLCAQRMLCLWYRYVCAGLLIHFSFFRSSKSCTLILYLDRCFTLVIIWRPCYSSANHFCSISYFSKGFLFGLTPALSAYHAASLFLYRLSFVQGKLIDLTPSEWFVKIFLSFMNSCNTHLSMYRLILSMQEFAAFLYPLPQEVPIVSFHTEASITHVTVIKMQIYRASW